MLHRTPRPSKGTLRFGENCIVYIAPERRQTLLHRCQADNTVGSDYESLTVSRGKVRCSFSFKKVITSKVLNALPRTKLISSASIVEIWYKRNERDPFVSMLETSSSIMSRKIFFFRQRRVGQPTIFPFEEHLPYFLKRFHSPTSESLRVKNYDLFDFECNSRKKENFILVEITLSEVQIKDVPCLI